MFRINYVTSKGYWISQRFFHQLPIFPDIVDGYLQTNEELINPHRMPVMNDNDTNNAVDIGQIAYSESTGNQFLTFELGGEIYGVDILQVREIKAWTPVTKIPNTSDAVEGVLNLRGEIVPVIDMRACFNLEKIEYTPFTVVIVLSLVDGTRSSRMIGIIADSVSDVVDINEEAIKPTPEFNESIKTDSVRNIATVNGKMIMLLDAIQLVNQSMAMPDDN